jgi:S-adenosylmethionine/arginine decarboxylase-like enzyme
MDSMYAGWHLTFDGIVDPAKAERLGDVAFLEETFLELVKILDMEVLVPPVFKVVPLEPEKMDSKLGDDGGVTGTCIITTSHLSIHTWPLRNRFAFDAFSCKEFDRHAAEDFLFSRFNVKIRSTHWLVRAWP